MASTTPHESDVRRGGQTAQVLSLAGFLVFSLYRASGQISPGELSAAHESLEGIANCTSCHTMGKTLSGEKCLACHTEVGSRISAGKGYHARLRGRQCADCHKEHHGRNFSIVRFDPASYDHAGGTGFALDGRHARIVCRECHRPANVKADDVRRLGGAAMERTYLGLSPECTACHRDVHEGRLPGNCRTCHSTEAWKPAPHFSHDRTRYPLTGRHVEVACVRCHAPPAGQTKVMRFAGIQFSSCASCHRDPHAGRFRERCETCHSTQGWRLAGANFNHSSTAFPLRGLHARVACSKCHGGTEKTGKSFHIVHFQECSDCHRDPHRRQFSRSSPGKKCASCHVETGWSDGTLKTFDHATTRFPLKGRHAAVPCRRCHGGAQAATSVVAVVDSLQFDRCGNCHTDPHAGQFAGVPADCGGCHREAGFTPSTFTIEMHGRTHFALDGGHLALPCSKCHGGTAAQGRGKFRKAAGTQCGDCHRDPHRGIFSRWSVSGCATCHVTSAWTQVGFAHDRTAFPLRGKHRDVRCAACHRAGDGEVWRFAGTPQACEACHAGKGKNG